MSRPLSIVLHRPIYSRNVGMCARAMANMGFSRLIVVSPQNQITDEAKQGAAHAQNELRGAIVYSSLEEFQAHEGDGLRIALSGKDHRLQTPRAFDQTVAAMAADSSHPFFASQTPIYLMFGAEDDGLSPEEMELCHHICFLPTFGELTSMNLSHAVLLALYVTRQSGILDVGGARSTAPAIQGPATAASTPLYHPKDSIHRWLETLGFDLSSPKVNIEKTLNRILLAQVPTPDELRILDSVLQQTIRRLKKSEPDR